MKKIKNLLLLLTLFSLVAIGFSSCVKKDYDEPTTANIDPPGIVANITIAQLQDSAGFVPYQITTDLVISGIIIADDESGNFYKEMIIQDSTAGISIQLDVSNFNTNYPMGRRVFVKCKGLFIADDGEGNFQLGLRDGGTIARIPQSLYEKYVVKGMWGLTPTPTVITLSNLNSVKTNTLVQLNNVEFKQSDAGVTYANATTLTYKNLTVSDCFGDEIVLYTSGYAKFAIDTTPTGKGTMIAVYKLYRGDGELVLRKPEEADMNGVRCNGSTGNYTLMPIDSLRMVYQGSTTTAPIDRKIKGIVISDLAGANLTNRNVVIQDATGGILVRFAATHILTLGQEVEVVVSGQELSKFNGLLQVNNVPNAAATVVGSGSVTPAVATISQILANYESYESTLVTIQNATISGSGTTFSGVKNITDNGGVDNMTFYTTTYSTFASDPFPTTPVNLTGIVHMSTTWTIPTAFSIRNLSDIN
ncbi:MAG TPA: DUF5689 domain-containing protein [Bacteroidia bacterium]|nr:DUF5689 domain-containing protein [Bacteroidia bacterium]HNS12456.1 DUF5689 domain-containing protein [Bacteroidia bacterium]